MPRAGVHIGAALKLCQSNLASQCGTRASSLANIILYLAGLLIARRTNWKKKSHLIWVSRFPVANVHVDIVLMGRRCQCIFIVVGDTAVSEANVHLGKIVGYIFPQHRVTIFVGDVAAADSTAVAGDRDIPLHAFLVVRIA
jgi:hypothetical protein